MHSIAIPISFAEKTMAHFDFSPLMKEVSGLSEPDLLKKIASHFPGKVALATSLSPEDQIVLHMLVQHQIPLRIFTLDTGRLFQETYELLEKTQLRYQQPVEVFFPDAAEVEEMVNGKGINLFYHSIENRKMCCNIRKIRPLTRALSGMKIWVTGLRREQAQTRQQMARLEWDEGNGLLKCNPLIDWTEQQVWDYIRHNGVPVNSLHKQGFPSIGCQPCTRAILPGEDIRAGRWWWESPDTRECGLHKPGQQD